MKRRLSVTADCTCDLSDKFLERYSVETLAFSIITERGCFLDREEITAGNVFEHITSGGSARSVAPDTDECISFFKKQLEKSEMIIHICMSSDISLSYRNCCEAMKIIGDDAQKIWIFDSRQVSTGLGHIVLRACELMEKNLDPAEIIKDLTVYRSRVMASFIVQSSEYLTGNLKINSYLCKMCEVFGCHPVIAVVNGKLKMKRFYRGDFMTSELKYIKSELKNAQKNDPKADTLRVFITHAGCTFREIDTLFKRVEKSRVFRNISITEASAVISSNCGPHTVGLLYVTQ